MTKNHSDKQVRAANVIRILTSLANGVDPHSGLVFPDDSPYHHPDNIRALFFAIENLKEIQKKGEGTHNSPLKWNLEQDNELKDRYLAGAALPELMQSMGRSRGALIARLKLLGLIDDADHVRD